MVTNPTKPTVRWHAIRAFLITTLLLVPCRYSIAQLDPLPPTSGLSSGHSLVSASSASSISLTLSGNWQGSVSPPSVDYPATASSGGTSWAEISAEVIGPGYVVFAASGQGIASASAPSGVTGVWPCPPGFFGDPASYASGVIGGGVSYGPSLWATTASHWWSDVDAYANAFFPQVAFAEISLGGGVSSGNYASYVPSSGSFRLYIQSTGLGFIRSCRLQGSGGIFTASYDFSMTGSLSFYPVHPIIAPRIDIPVLNGPAIDGVITTAGPDCNPPPFNIVEGGLGDDTGLGDGGWMDGIMATDGCRGSQWANLPWNHGELVDPGDFSGLTQAQIALNIGTSYRNAQLTGTPLSSALFMKIQSGELTPGQINLWGASHGGVLDGSGASILNQRLRQYFAQQGHHDPVSAARLSRLVLFDVPNKRVLRGHENIDPGNFESVLNLYCNVGQGCFGSTLPPSENVVNIDVDISSRGAVTLPPGVYIGHQKLPFLWPELGPLLRDKAAGNYQATYNAETRTWEVERQESQSPIAIDWIEGERILQAFGIEKLGEWRGLNTSFHANELAARLDEPADPVSAAQIHRSALMPADAKYMEFEYRVLNAADGDVLSVTFGDTVLFQRPLYGVQSDFISSTHIYVGDGAGLIDTVAITLTPVGMTGASVLLRNLEFTDLTIAGDLDFNGVVDRGDVAVFARHIGTRAGAGFEDGDLNADGRVSLEDLTRLGVSLSQGTPRNPSAVIPEPRTLLLSLMAALVMAFARTRQEC